MRLVVAFVLAGLIYASGQWSSDAFGADESKDKAATAPETVSYFNDIRPVLQQHCQGCHQPAKAGGDYVMTSYDDLFAAGSSDVEPIVAGKPSEAGLIEQVISVDDKPAKMPKGKPPLANHEVALIRKWIEQGAKDDTPESARETVVDMDHPPVYQATPVLTSLDYSPDGSLLAVSGYHEVLLHKADGSGLVARLVGISDRIQSLAFSPDGKELAVAAGVPFRFGELQIWNVADRTLRLSLPVTYDTIYGASWSHDGKLISFGCADNTVRAIDAKTGAQVLFQGAHSGWVIDTVFSTDASHLVSVSRDMSMKLTQVATERFVDNITSITPGALKGGLLTVTRDPNKDELLIGGADGAPKIYRMYRQKARRIGDDFNLVRKFDPLPGRIFAAAYAPDGSWIVVGSSLNGVGEVRAYQTADGKLISKFAGQKGAVYAVSVRPDGMAVASAGFDGIVRLNDPKNGKLIKQFVPVPVGADATASVDAGSE